MSRTPDWARVGRELGRERGTLDKHAGIDRRDAHIVIPPPAGPAYGPAFRLGYVEAITGLTDPLRLW